MGSEFVILGGARTPMTEWVGGKTGDGQPGGKLASVSANDLGAAAAKGALDKTGVPADKIEHVIMGNALQTSGDAIYGARHVALNAGLPKAVPALTVNRLCGSGIQSVIEGGACELEFLAESLGMARFPVLSKVGAAQIGDTDGVQFIGFGALRIAIGRNTFEVDTVIHVPICRHGK